MEVGEILTEGFLGAGDKPVEVDLGVRVIVGGAVAPAFRFAHVALTVKGVDLLRHVAHVVAAIGVGWKRDLHAAQLEIPQPAGQCEDVHLPTRIVHVVLALDAVASGIENVCEARPERCPPPVADVQRAGRIRRYELDQHALPLSVVAAPERVAGAQHLADDLLFRARPQDQIDEPRASHLGLQKVRR